MHALHSSRSCARPQPGLEACYRHQRNTVVSVKAVKTQPSSPWQDVVQQYKGMVQAPAGAQAPAMDKPKPSKQQTSKAGKPKSSTPVKAKPVKTTQTTGQRSTTQPAAVKPSKPSAAAAMQQKQQQQQQQQKQGTKPAARKQRDWPQVEPMEVDDMQPSTSGRLPPTAASTAVAGGTAISTGRGFGRLAPVAESDAEGAPQRLRLFAYAVESKRVMAALQECGLDHRFVFTPDLKQAQAIVSCKMTPGGKTQNLAQGERAAVKAGIPFVVLGRVVTKTTVGRALQPLLQSPGGSSSSSSSGGGSSSSSSSSDKQSMSDLAAQWHAMGAARAAGY